MTSLFLKLLLIQGFVGGTLGGRYLGRRYLGLAVPWARGTLGCGTLGAVPWAAVPWGVPHPFNFLSFFANPTSIIKESPLLSTHFPFQIQLSLIVRLWTAYLKSPQPLSIIFCLFSAQNDRGRDFIKITKI